MYVIGILQWWKNLLRYIAIMLWGGSSCVTVLHRRRYQMGYWLSDYLQSNARSGLTPGMRKKSLYMQQLEKQGLVQKKVQCCISATHTNDGSSITTHPTRDPRLAALGKKLLKSFHEQEVFVICKDSYLILCWKCHKPLISNAYCVESMSQTTPLICAGNTSQRLIICGLLYLIKLLRWVKKNFANFNTVVFSMKLGERHENIYIWAFYFLGIVCYVQVPTVLLTLQTS